MFQVSICEQVTQCESPENCPTHLVIIRGYTLEAKCKQMVQITSNLKFDGFGAGCVWGFCCFGFFFPWEYIHSFKIIHQLTSCRFFLVTVLCNAYQIIFRS